MFVKRAQLTIARELQFVNFNTYRHDDPRDLKRSNIILQGVVRQILEKCGVHIWWVQIPRELPLPCVMVGVDVYHAPRVFNPITKEKVKFVSGDETKIEMIGPYIDVDQAMPFLLPGGKQIEPVNLQRMLYEIPFDHAYNE